MPQFYRRSLRALLAGRDHRDREGIENHRQTTSDYQIHRLVTAVLLSIYQQTTYVSLDAYIEISYK